MEDIKATIIFVAESNPYYNQDLYQSIKFFTHNPYNLIIVNNHASNGTADFLSQLGNCTILRPKTKLSLSQAANHALQQVDTPYVVYFHKGEALICGHYWLRDVIEFMENNLDVGLAGDVRFPGKHRIESILSGRYDNSQLSPNWLLHNESNMLQLKHVQGGSMVMRTSMVRRIGCFNENYVDRLMDVEYALRAMSRDFKLGKIPFILSPQPGYDDALQLYRLPLHRVINTGHLMPLRQKLRRLWEETLNKSKQESKPLLSVIIGVRNRDDQLQYSLRTLIEQTLPRSSYEIILVNYGGDDEEKTQRILEYIDPNIRYIYTHEKGVWCNARARNIGVRAARSDLICFLNPDGLFEQNLLEEIVKVHQSHPKGVLVQGRRFDLPPVVTEAVMNGQFDGDLKRIFRTNNYKLHNISAEGDCQSFPKDIYIAIGGYDEDYTGWGADDNDFAHRVVNFGLLKVWLNPNRCLLLHLHHGRNYTNRHQNRLLFNSRRGQLIRNVGKTWGEVREKA